MISRRAMVLLGGGAGGVLAQSYLPGIPNIGVKADTGPARSESGVGALMPWADALWAVTYDSHMQSTGSGLGLYRIDEKLQIERVHVHNGTHANRFVHTASNQAFIGPYAIDLAGKPRVIEPFLKHRLTATTSHLSDPANRVYTLTMEGLLFEVDVASLKPRLIADLVKEFRLKAAPHFKGAFTAQGRLVVANNGFYRFGEEQAGLHEWDGKRWNAISRKPHVECAGRNNMGRVIFCTGWDESSVLFWALVKGKWQKYRLPFASHAFMHAWQTEWMRIREIETERFMMDIHGMLYELQPIAFEDAIWGVKPVCQHLRVIPDYCSYRGLLAVAGNENTPNADANPVGGQPQSGIWFGKTDDLWSWGKPAGWGGPWRKGAVSKDQPSAPFLMTGFGNKVLHLKSDQPAAFDVEIDFLGNGSWDRYERIAVGAAGYQFHVFPTGFSAHWVRLIPRANCTASAQFVYT
jgi:hypothetical protein